MLACNDDTNIFRDFAHAPSKVKATIEAVKQQYPDRRLIAVLELHTYSSLNAAFMPQYEGALDAANAACVFYSHHAMEVKKMSDLPEDAVRNGFKQLDLFIANTKEQLEEWLDKQDLQNANLLLMSSGNYDGLDLEKLAGRIKK